MLKKLSGLTDVKLKYYVDRVREIAALGNEAAIIEVDKLVWEIIDKEELPPDESSEEDDLKFEIDEAKEEITNFIDEVNELRRNLKKGAMRDFWLVENLRDELHDLGDSWSQEVAVELSQELHDVRTLAEPVIQEGEAWAVLQNENREKQEHLAHIKDGLKRTIYNYSSVQSIISQSDLAYEFLQEKGHLTEELKEKIRKVKERAGMFRRTRSLLKQRQ